MSIQHGFQLSKWKVGSRASAAIGLAAALFSVNGAFAAPTPVSLAPPLAQPSSTMQDGSGGDPTAARPATGSGGEPTAKVAVGSGGGSVMARTVSGSGEDPVPPMAQTGSGGDPVVSVPEKGSGGEPMTGSGGEPRMTQTGSGGEPMTPPVSQQAPTTDTQSQVFQWTEVPANQNVPITRAVFDHGGYQLYDTVGETIVVPFTNDNLYVMKFCKSADDTMYFVNTGSVPVLYVPRNGYLENATVAGARWYPFSKDYCPTTPVFLGVAPSWDAYVGMGWYPGMICYGGYWCDGPYLVTGVCYPTDGLCFVIGADLFFGWGPYHAYYLGHPGWDHVGWANRGFYGYHGGGGGFRGVAGGFRGGAGGFGGGGFRGTQTGFRGGAGGFGGSSAHVFHGATGGFGGSRSGFSGSRSGFGGARVGSGAGAEFRGAGAGGGSRAMYMHRSFSGGSGSSFNGGGRSFSGGGRSLGEGGGRSFGGSSRSFGGGGGRSFGGGGRSFGGGGGGGRSRR